MDEAYRTIAEDIQRVLPEEYLVSDVTPVEYSKIAMDPGVPDEIRKTGNYDTANFMAVIVQIRDEYREGWWKGNPTIWVGFDKQHVQGPAGLGDLLKPEIEKKFAALKKELSQAKKPRAKKQTTGTSKATPAKA